MASIHKHDRGWIVRWEGGRDVNGKRVRRSKVLKNHSDAKEYRNRIAATEGRSSDSAPLSKCMLEWIDQREDMRTISPKTAERQRNIARNLGKCLGDPLIHKVDARAVNHSMIQLGKGGGHSGRPLAARTVMHHRTLLSQFCRTLVAQGRIPRNPVDGTERINLPKVRAEAPTIEQVEALLALCSRSAKCNGLLRLIVLTALHTGARRGEILALRWKDLDINSRKLSIVRSIEQTSSHGLRFKAPKTQAGRRIIPCSGTLVSALSGHRSAQAEQRIGAGPAWADNDLIFSNALGEAIRPEDVSRSVGLMARKAGFSKNVAPLHGLRHLHGTQLNAAGMDAKTI